MPKPGNKLNITVTQEEMDEADFDPDIQKAGDELLNGLDLNETIYIEKEEPEKDLKDLENLDIQKAGDEYLNGLDLNETIYIEKEEPEKDLKDLENLDIQKAGDEYLNGLDLNETIYPDKDPQERNSVHENPESQRSSVNSSLDSSQDSSLDNSHNAQERSSFVDDFEIVDELEGLEEFERERKKVLNEYKALEEAGDYKGIVDKAIDMFHRNEMDDVTDAERKGQEDYIRTIYGQAEEDYGNVTKIPPERMQVFEEICRAAGAKRAVHSVALGKEAEELREKIKSGEIKGAERWKDDDKALGTIAASYLDRTSRNAYERDAVPNALLPFVMQTNPADSKRMAECMTEGAKGYPASFTDEKEREKAQKYFDLGSKASYSNAGKYGLTVNEGGGTDKKTFFVNSETQKKVTNLTDPKELERFEKQNSLDSQKVDETMKLARKIIDGAQRDLALLEKMQKAGHTNGKEYNRMHDALKELANLDLEKATSMSGLTSKLETLEKTAGEYEKSHDKWYKAGKGYGADRLEMSKHLKEMASGAGKLLPDLPKEYRSRTLSGLQTELQQNQAVIDRAWQDRGGKENALMLAVAEKVDARKEQRRKLEVNEVQELLKGDAPKHEGRRSVHEPAKRPELEKNTEVKHGVNDVMQSNRVLKK